jgi:MOSC domain-containing protein YiiM
LHTTTLAELMGRFPRAGRVEWIGLRPARRQGMQAVMRAAVSLPEGLEGDRYAGRSGRRAVTLIQAEHLDVVASLAGWDAIDPAQLRRNVVVRGINLVALKDRRFRIGSAVLEATGPCDPCSRMEEVLGEGGYNAMRGHGGITARVIEAGAFEVGDAVAVL